MHDANLILWSYSTSTAFNLWYLLPLATINMRKFKEIVITELYLAVLAI